LDHRRARRADHDPLTYRSTCGALQHEKYLFLANAPPYAGHSDPRALLAERVESMFAEEESKWAAAQLPAGKGKAQSNQR